MLHSSECYKMLFTSHDAKYSAGEAYGSSANEGKGAANDSVMTQWNELENAVWAHSCGGSLTYENPLKAFWVTKKKNLVVAETLLFASFKRYRFLLPRHRNLPSQQIQCNTLTVLAFIWMRMWVQSKVKNIRPLPRTYIQLVANGKKCKFVKPHKRLAYCVRVKHKTIHTGCISTCAQCYWRWMN